MMKKREREAAAYVNLKPRNASMAVEVSTLNCQLTLFSVLCCLAGVFLQLENIISIISDIP